jgi:hypothetical protein
MMLGLIDLLELFSGLKKMQILLLDVLVGEWMTLLVEADDRLWRMKKFMLEIQI